MGYRTPPSPPIVVDIFPGGGDGAVQFNDGGIFGGEPELFWDKIGKRLGIGVAPEHSLDVAGAIHTQAPGEAVGTEVSGTPPDEVLDTGFRFTASQIRYGLFVRAKTSGLNPDEAVPVEALMLKRIA